MVSNLSRASSRFGTQYRMIQARAYSEKKQQKVSDFTSWESVVLPPLDF